MVSRSRKVSVVVPCYNVEGYLRRCLDSLLAQSHPDVEVIMVEDCSTDGTKIIVEEYEKKYRNFRAIYNKENGGLGNARNVGISAARSRYIAFLDSDDWLPRNFLSEMLDTLEASGSDISICDIYLRYDDSGKDQRVKSYDTEPNKLGLINTSMAASSSNKLFKTELFNDVRYPIGIVNEDIPVTLMLMSKYKVAYTANTHFNYYQRPGSIQNSKITRKRFDTFKSVDLLKKNLGGHIDDDIWQAVVWHQIIAVFLYVIPRARGVMYRKGLIEEFHGLLEEYEIDISNNPGLENFASTRKANRLYSKLVIDYLASKKFTRLSLLMWVHSKYTNSPIVRVLVSAIRHPRRFTSQVINRIKPKKQVIKTDVSMNDIITAAKEHSFLPDSEIRLSAVIPNYNYERYLLQRIYSILAQTKRVSEIIILDDVSSDNSVQLASSVQQKIDKYIPVRLINNKTNQGVFRQWERGFSESRGDYVWIAEADDYASPRFLEYALAPFDINSNIVISYVNTGYVNKSGVLLGNVRADIDYQKSGHWDSDYINSGIDEAKTYSYLNNTIANVSSVVFKKKSDIDYSKLFADALDYKQAGDWVFYVNYMLYGDVAYTNKVLNYYRMHGDNVSSTMKAQDHIAEIKKIQKVFTKKLRLSKAQQKKMKDRVEFLNKAWRVNSIN